MTKSKVARKNRNKLKFTALFLAERDRCRKAENGRDNRFVKSSNECDLINTPLQWVAESSEDGSILVFRPVPR